MDASIATLRPNRVLISCSYNGKMINVRQREDDYTSRDRSRSVLGEKSSETFDPHGLSKRGVTSRDEGNITSSKPHGARGNQKSQEKSQAQIFPGAEDCP